jgi:hypothetical protein
LLLDKLAASQACVAYIDSQSRSRTPLTPGIGTRRNAMIIDERHIENNLQHFTRSLTSSKHLEIGEKLLFTSTYPENV